MACLFSLGPSQPPGVDYLIEQGLLPPAPPADQYSWESFARDEELVTTSDSVVWTQGGTVKRLLRFDQEGQSIIQATLTWFDVDRSDQLPSKATLSAEKVSRRALVVLLTKQAHVFFLDGSSHVVHLPCEIEQAFPTSKGVLLRRNINDTETSSQLPQFTPPAPPNSFLSPRGAGHRTASVFSPSSHHQQTIRFTTRRKSTLRSLDDFTIDVGTDSEEDLPLYLTLTDPLLPVGLAVESLGPVQYTSSPYHNRTTSLETVALGNDEELLYISPTNELDLIPSSSPEPTRPLMLCLTCNRATNSYNVWYCSFQQTKSIISWKRQQAETSDRANQSARKAQLLFQSGPSQRQSSGRDSFGRPVNDIRPFPGSRTKTRRSEKLQVEKNRKSEAMKPKLESPEKAKAANRRTSSMLARTELGSQIAAGSLDWGHHGHAIGHGHRTSNTLPSFGRAHADRRSFRASQASARASFAGTLGVDEDASMQDDSVLGLSDLDENKFTGYEDFFDMDLQDPFDDTRRDLMLLKVASISAEAAGIAPPATSMEVVLLVNDGETSPSTDKNRQISWLLWNRENGVLAELRMPLDVVSRNRGQDHLVAPRMNQIEARSIPDILGLGAVSHGTQKRAVMLAKGYQTHLLLYPGTCGSSQPNHSPRLFQEMEEVPFPSASSEISATLLKVHLPPNSRLEDKVTSSSTVINLKNRHNSSYVEFIDETRSWRLLKVLLQPNNSYVRKIIDVCGHIMPASCGGHPAMLALFWSVRGLPADGSEWQKLRIALFSLIVPFLPTNGSGLKESTASAPDVLHSPEVETPDPRFLWQRLHSGGQSPTVLKAAVQEATDVTLNGSQKGALLRNASRGVIESFFRIMLVALHLLRQEELLHAASVECSVEHGSFVVSMLAQIGSWLGWKDWGHESEWYLKASTKQQRPSFDTRRLKGLECQPPQIPPPDIFAALVQSTHDIHQSFLRLHDVLVDASDALAAEDAPSRYGQVLFVDKRYFPRLVTITQMVLGKGKAVNEHSRALEDDSLSAGANTIPHSLPDYLSVLLRGQVEGTSLGQSESRSNSSTNLQHQQLIPVPAHLIEPTPAADLLTVGELGAASAAIIGTPRTEVKAVAPVMYSQNTTYHEGVRLLSSHVHSSGVLHSKPGDSESKFLEAERAHAQLVGIRSTAVTTGTALMDFQRIRPLPTQELEIGLWETQIKMLPSGHIMTLSRDNFTEPKSAWAAYHIGVAAGLSVVRGISAIDHSWICLNKPQEPNNRHSGLLLGLGLNNYLRDMPRWLVFKYLTTKHEMTSVSLLIGLAASHIGTMNSLVVKVLSIHLVSLLPAGAAELNLSSLVQTAGTMGVGLLYCNTHHRRMSEVMLSDLKSEDGDDSSDPSSKFIPNEGYRLSAGFALGLINLGHGNDLRALYGMDIEQRLLAAATGLKDVHSANFTNDAMAGSIVAIALIYMKSEDRNLAMKIGCPATRPRFDYVRPDILLLRVLASKMIMWQGIEASDAWIMRNLPLDLHEVVAGISDPGQRAQALAGRALRKGNSGQRERMQTTRMHQYNIVSGLLWSIGLKYGGSGDLAARDFILMYYDAMNALDETSTTTYDKRLVYVALLRLQHLLLLAAATVMSGTGDIHVLRRARILHGTINEHSTYGLHQASHMIIGALFLGQGRYAFGTSNLAIASLICAFYPLFPKDIMDNKAHLQAFRHLWVLAAEPRALLARDEETQSVVNLPVNIILKDGTSRTMKTPALLQPSLEDISKVAIVSGEYWPAALDFQDEQDLQQYRSTQTLWVRKRTLLAQYDNDAFEVSLAQKRLESLNTSNTVHGSNDLTDWIFDSPVYRKTGLSRADLDSTLPRTTPSDQAEPDRHPDERLTKLKRDVGDRKRKVEHELLKTMPTLAQYYAPSPQKDAETKHEAPDVAEEHLPPIRSLLDISTTKVDDILSLWGYARHRERPYELEVLFAMSPETRNGCLSEDAVYASRAEVTRQDAGLNDWLKTINEDNTKHQERPGLDSSTVSDKPTETVAYEPIFAGLASDNDDNDGNDPMDIDDAGTVNEGQSRQASDEEWIQ